MDSLNLSQEITKLIQNKKGYDIKILDLRKLTAISDYFVICSADSDTQVKAISKEIDDKLRDLGIRCIHKEGHNTLNWVLLDYFDVIVHVFRLESRNYYRLENLWGDAPVIEIPDEI